MKTRSKKYRNRKLFLLCLFLLLLRLALVFLLDDPGVDALGVVGDNLSDQAL